MDRQDDRYRPGCSGAWGQERIALSDVFPETVAEGRDGDFSKSDRGGKDTGGGGEYQIHRASAPVSFSPPPHKTTSEADSCDDDVRGAGGGQFALRIEGAEGDPSSQGRGCLLNQNPSRRGLSVVFAEDVVLAAGGGGYGGSGRQGVLVVGELGPPGGAPPGGRRRRGGGDPQRKGRYPDRIFRTPPLPSPSLGIEPPSRSSSPSWHSSVAAAAAKAAAAIGPMVAIGGPSVRDWETGVWMIPQLTTAVPRRLPDENTASGSTPLRPSSSTKAMEDGGGSAEPSGAPAVRDPRAIPPERCGGGDDGRAEGDISAAVAVKDGRGPIEGPGRGGRGRRGAGYETTTSASSSARSAAERGDVRHESPPRFPTEPGGGRHESPPFVAVESTPGRRDPTDFSTLLMEKTFDNYSPEEDHWRQLQPYDKEPSDGWTTTSEIDDQSNGDSGGGDRRIIAGTPPPLLDSRLMGDVDDEDGLFVPRYLSCDPDEHRVIPRAAEDLSVCEGSGSESEGEGTVVSAMTEKNLASLDATPAAGTDGGGIVVGPYSDRSSSGVRAILSGELYGNSEGDGDDDYYVLPRQRMLFRSLRARTGDLWQSKSPQTPRGTRGRRQGKGGKKKRGKGNGGRRLRSVRDVLVGVCLRAALGGAAARTGKEDPEGSGGGFKDDGGGDAAYAGREASEAEARHQTVLWDLGGVHLRGVHTIPQP